MMWAVLASMWAACIPTSKTVTDQGFTHAKYPGYRVTPASVTQAGSSLMGPNWILDNFYKKKRALIEKTTPAYRCTIAIDADGDGRFDFKQEIATFDLRFVHRNRDAVIWLRTIPISSDMTDMELAVIAQRYVDGMAGAGYAAVQVNATTVVAAERRYAARIAERATARVGGRNAFVATVDLANIDQFKVTPGVYTSRIELVFLKAPFPHTYYRNGTERAELPVMIVAGYKNLPGDFEQDLPDFREFLGRLELDGSRGLVGPVLEAAPGLVPEDPPPAQPTPVAAPAAPPPTPLTPTAPAAPTAPASAPAVPTGAEKPAAESSSTPATAAPPATSQ